MLTGGRLQGEILVAGQRAFFEAEINELGITATFDPHPSSEARVDDWQLLRALERFIEEHLRG
jgi:hypothetical protein